jgi:hypothetical protein
METFLTALLYAALANKASLGLAFAWLIREYPLIVRLGGAYSIVRKFFYNPTTV